MRAPSPTIPCGGDDDQDVGALLSPAQSWTALSVGGHSFVFRALVGTRSGVLKIFRLPPQPAAAGQRSPTARTSPYLYSARESSAYALLDAHRVAAVPQRARFLTLPSAHEDALEPAFQARGFYPARERRRLGATREELPLRAVWMEEIAGGVRLTRGMRRGRETLQALREIHAAGVLHGDVKWRNVLVEDGAGRVRWVDFSNAAVRTEVVDEATWERMVEEEVRGCRKMLGLVKEEEKEEEEEEKE